MFSFNWGAKGDALKKSVSIHRNGDYDLSKVLYIEPGWKIRDLLKTATSRLDMNPPAEIVYDKNGNQVDDCLLIEDNDMLFFSSGDPFCPPRDQSFRNSMRSVLPSVVGPYRVKKLLGRGGFGEVRVGVHQMTEERVALKFIRKMDILDIDALNRTVNEIQCLHSLKNQNIITMIEHQQTPDYLVLIFEVMEGGDLGAYMHARGTTPEERRLSASDARLVFTQVVNGVSYAHNQNIIHRDLKLENILLKGPTLSNVKIADFGLSAFYRPGSMIHTNCGTLSYLAPEVFGEYASAGPPMDIWALGVILFAMLCGRLPFDEHYRGTKDDHFTKRRRNSDAAVQSRIVKGTYQIDYDLSIESKDLIGRLLTVDPIERCSLPEALSHPWMRMMLTDSVATSVLQAATAGLSAALASGAVVDENGEIRPKSGRHRPKNHDEHAPGSVSNVVTSQTPLSALTDSQNQGSVGDSTVLVHGNESDKISSSEKEASSHEETSGKDGVISNKHPFASQLHSEDQQLAQIKSIEPLEKPETFKLQRLRNSGRDLAHNVDSDDDDDADEIAAARTRERIRNVLNSTANVSLTPVSAAVGASTVDEAATSTGKTPTVKGRRNTTSGESRTPKSIPNAGKPVPSTRPHSSTGEILNDAINQEIAEMSQSHHHHDVTLNPHQRTSGPSEAFVHEFSSSSPAPAVTTMGQSRSTTPASVLSASPVNAAMKESALMKTIGRTDSGNGSEGSMKQPQLHSGIAGLSNNAAVPSFPVSASDKVAGLAIFGNSSLTPPPTDVNGAFPPKTHVSKPSVKRNTSISRILESDSPVQATGAFARRISDPVAVASNKITASSRPVVQRQNSVPPTSRDTDGANTLTSMTKGEFSLRDGESHVSTVEREAFRQVSNSRGEEEAPDKGRNLLDEILRPLSAASRAPSGKPHISI